MWSLGHFESSEDVHVVVSARRQHSLQVAAPAMSKLLEFSDSSSSATLIEAW